MKKLSVYPEIFFTETAGGTNRKGMTDWNEYIYSRLQINNLQLFRVTFKY